MLEQVEADLKQIGNDISQSLANHNFLLGAKAGLENLLNRLKVAALTADVSAIAESVAGDVIVELIEGEEAAPKEPDAAA